MMRQLALLVCTTIFLTVSVAQAGDSKSGSWQTKTYKTTGGWSLVESDGKAYIELSDSFSTKSVPDLKLFLSKQASSNVNKKNASSGVFVAKVKSNKGKQRYAVPSGVDLSEYKTVVLHCDKYSVLIAVSGL